MKVSIIIPCYNEEAVIQASLATLLTNISSLSDFELIVVNDGSRDNTLALLKAFAEREPRLTVLSYPSNRGRGYALRAGFRQATGDLIVTTEADSSWGDDIVFRLVNALNENPEYDMVIASPHRQGGSYVNVPWHRVLLSSIGNVILSRAVGHGITMSSGMTRAYRAYVVQDLSLEESGKEIHLEILSKCLDLGYRVMEIPATLTWKTARRAESARGKRSSFNARKLIFSHLLFSFNESPMLLAGTLSFLFITMGLLIGCYLIYEWIANVLNPVRPLMTIMVLLIITGLQMMIFTFLAYQNRLLKRALLRTQMSSDTDMRFKNVTAYKGGTEPTNQRTNEI